MSFTAFQVRVRQRPGVRSQERQWWEMFPRSQEQRAQCGEGSLRGLSDRESFFLKLDDRWHEFRRRQGDGERGFSPENKIPDASSIQPLI